MVSNQETLLTSFDSPLANREKAPLISLLLEDLKSVLSVQLAKMQLELKADQDSKIQVTVDMADDALCMCIILRIAHVET